jgi:hypothetical protein
MLALMLFTSLATAAPGAATATVTDAVFVNVVVPDGADAALREAAPVVARRVAERIGARTGLPTSTPADLRALADIEATRLLGGCDEDTTCLAEIAAAAGSRHVVSGELRRFGGELVLLLSLTDANAARNLGRGEARAADLPALERAIPAAVDPLVAPLGVIDDGPGAAFVAGGALLGVGAVAGVGLGLWSAVLEGQLTDTSVAGTDKQFAYDQGWLVASGAIAGGVVAAAGLGLVALDLVGGP